MTAAVEPEKILHDLAELWVSLGKEQSSGVLRACAMTLIVAVDSARDAASASETLALLMHEHPSRAIVLKLDETSRDTLDARVFAQCWMPFGRQQQICCEQVEITASSDRLEGVTPVILGITVPDLPVMLWCRSPTILERPELEQLRPLTRKIIVDSAAMGPPSPALARVHSLCNRWRQVSDLAWTRLTRWRELVAHAFEEPGRRHRLRDIGEAIIVHTGEPPSTSALYLGAWLQSALGNGREIRLHFRSAPGEDGEPIHHLELKAGEWTAAFQLDHCTAVVQCEGTQSKVVLPVASEYGLLREEVSILENDLVFNRALENAVRTTQP